MLPSRRAVAAAAAASVALAVLVTGCSGDDGDSPGAPTPAATVSPTAPGDRPLVDVLSDGADARQPLALALEADSSVEASLVVSQEVVADRRVTPVPEITVPFTSVVTGADGDELATEQTFATPTVDDAGLAPSDVESVTAALAALTGTTSQLVVRRDGTTVRAADGVAAAAQVDSQVRLLVPVLPTDDVGVGASWTATSVAVVDGATVDQVATYTLTSLDGDAYVIGLEVDQQYLPGSIEGVEVQSGRGTLTATLEGSLRSLLPSKATASQSTTVSYVVGGATTEVRTTVSLGLTAG